MPRKRIGFYEKRHRETMAFITGLQELVPEACKTAVKAYRTRQRQAAKAFRAHLRDEFKASLQRIRAQAGQREP